ncbi:MAG: hypothetical protein OXK82_08065 [Deltaproteobacteria bacterium]|nr:hypothetical protein [Deltaproteobacteria bacterium]
MPEPVRSSPPDSPAFDPILHDRSVVHARTRDWLVGLSCEPDEVEVHCFVAKLLAEQPTMLPDDCEDDPQELVTGWVLEQIDNMKRKGQLSS